MSTSAVSSDFVGRTKENLIGLMSRRVDDVRLAVPMLDGIELKGRRTNLVAPGITTEGVKVPLGLWDASTENKTVATTLRADLVDRGLDGEQRALGGDRRRQCVRATVRAVLGERTPSSAVSVAMPTCW